MKKIFTILIATLITATLWAQSPEKMSYQAVIRNSSDALVTNTNVGMQISILQSSATGTAVYMETQTPTTNTNGLATVEIGGGTVVSGDFSAIDWSAGPYFIKTETDPTGGTSYTITGTSQLLSTPYALYAKTADDIHGGINYDEIENTPVTAGVDSSYVVSLNQDEEDFVDFGTIEGFTNGTSWSIIEKVKFPSTTSGGWHFFRGLAWTDKEGDIAISINADRVHAWVNKGGWTNVIYDPTENINADTWYTICLQYDYNSSTLSLFVNGTLEASSSVSPMDDSGNTNKLFFGGQDVLPNRNEGDLYSEASITIANQAWFQRLLTTDEIANYDGLVDASDPTLFFSTKISNTNITDASGNGHNGVNGNTPEYIGDVYTYSEFNDPVNINSNVALTGNMQITGDIDNLSSSGMTVIAPIGANSTGFGAALYVSSDGTLQEADADAVGTMPCVALAVESGTGDKEILLQGFIKNEAWSWTPGGMIYVSPTTGAITQTAPSATGQQVQIIGVAVSNDMVYFIPNLMLIEIK